MEGKKNDLHKVFGEWFVIYCQGRVRLAVAALCLYIVYWGTGDVDLCGACEVTGSAQDGRRIARGKGEGHLRERHSKESLKEQRGLEGSVSHRKAPIDSTSQQEACTACSSETLF